MHNNRMSSSAWTTRNILLPLVPFFMQAGIRFIILMVSNKYSIVDALSKSPDFPTLMITLGFLNVLVYESLFNARTPIENKQVLEDISEEISLWASRFLVFALVCFVFFSVIVVCDALLLDSPITIAEQLLGIFKLLSVALFIVIIILAKRVRSAFNLKAAGV